MPKLTVVGNGTFDVKEGTKLVLALEDNGIHILHRCGGKARCTTCRVEIVSGDFCEPTHIEKNTITEKELKIICDCRVKCTYIQTLLFVLY